MRMHACTQYPKFLVESTFFKYFRKKKTERKIYRKKDRRKSEYLESTINEYPNDVNKAQLRILEILT